MVRSWMMSRSSSANAAIMVANPAAAVPLVTRTRAQGW